MTAYTELVSTLTQLLRRVQPAHNYQPALLGDGNGTVSVTNQPGYSYVRMLTDLSKTIKVWGSQVNGYDGLPVLVGSFPWTPDLVQIIDVDWNVFVQVQQNGWDPTVTYVPRHGHTHLSSSSDPADTDKDNIVPLHLHPYAASGSWWVEVNADFYPYASSRKYFQGGRFNLEPYMSGSSHYVTISIDPITNSLVATNGPSLGLLSNPADLEAAFPVPPIGNVIAGTVYWAPGITSITTSIIFPDRLMWQPLGGATIPFYGTGSITPQPVGPTGIAGSSLYPSRADHVHQGIHSIRVTGSTAMVGDAYFVAGTGVTLTQSGQVIKISSSGGVTSVRATGSAAILGDVYLTAGNGIVLTESGQVISIATSTVATKKTAIFTFVSSLTVQSGVIRFYNATGDNFTILKVFLAVDTVPAGASIIVDINKGGTTIFTTQANRPAITAGNNTGFSTAIDVTAFNDGEYLTADIDQVGVTPGSNLTVEVIYQ